MQKRVVSAGRFGANLPIAVPLRLGLRKCPRARAPRSGIRTDRSRPAARPPSSTTFVPLTSSSPLPKQAGFSDGKSTRQSEAAWNNSLVAWNPISESESDRWTITPSLLSLRTDIPRIHPELFSPAFLEAVRLSGCNSNPNARARTRFRIRKLVEDMDVRTSRTALSRRIA